jgi:hypothetical protein
MVFANESVTICHVFIFSDELRRTSVRINENGSLYRRGNHPPRPKAAVHFVHFVHRSFRSSYMLTAC